jgi:hypothetical protein
MHRRARHFNARDAGAVLVLDSRFIRGLADGDLASTWENRLESGVDATASGSLRPTYKTNQLNGNPVLRFFGNPNYFTVATTSISQPITVCSVINITSGAFYGTISGSATQQILGNFFGAFNFYAGSAFLTSTQWSGANIAVALFNGSNSSVTKNGITNITGNPGTAPLTSQLRVGSLEGNVYPFVGDYGMLIVLTNAVSGSMQSRIRQAAAFSFKIPCN